MARKSDQRREPSGEAPLERLRTFGDPALRQQTKIVTVFDARLEKLAKVMLEVMHREEGVGLAAPQIGVRQPGDGLERPRARGRRVCLREPGDRLRVPRSAPRPPRAACRCPDCRVEVERCNAVTVKARTWAATRSNSRQRGSWLASCSTRSTTSTAGSYSIEPRPRSGAGSSRSFASVPWRRTSELRIRRHPGFRGLDPRTPGEPGASSLPGHLAARPSGGAGTAGDRACGGGRRSASGVGSHPARRYQCARRSWSGCGRPAPESWWWPHSARY